MHKQRAAVRPAATRKVGMLKTPKFSTGDRVKFASHPESKTPRNHGGIVQKMASISPMNLKKGKCKCEETKKTSKKIHTQHNSKIQQNMDTYQREK